MQRYEYLLNVSDFLTFFKSGWKYLGRKITGGIVGILKGELITFCFYREKKNGELYIDFFFISPSFQGKGLGANLFTSLVESRNVRPTHINSGEQGYWTSKKLQFNCNSDNHGWMELSSEIVFDLFGENKNEDDFLFVFNPTSDQKDEKERRWKDEHLILEVELHPMGGIQNETNRTCRSCCGLQMWIFWIDKDKANIQTAQEKWDLFGWSNQRWELEQIYLNRSGSFCDRKFRWNKEGRTLSSVQGHLSAVLPQTFAFPLSKYSICYNHSWYYNWR